VALVILGAGKFKGKAMKKGGVYKSKASAAIHEMATDLHESGIVDKNTLLEFDKTCLTPKCATPTYAVACGCMTQTIHARL
jgi:hypothetical protein